MKKTALLLIFIMAISFANAQDSYQNDEVRTIFSKNKSNGGYGAFTVSYSNIGGYDALVTTNIRITYCEGSISTCHRVGWLWFCK